MSLTSWPERSAAKYLHFYHDIRMINREFIDNKVSSPLKLLVYEIKKGLKTARAVHGIAKAWSVDQGNLPV